MSTKMRSHYTKLPTSILAVVIWVAAVSGAAAAPATAIGPGSSSAVPYIPIAGSIYDDADPTGIRYVRRLIYRPHTSPPESEREVVVTPGKASTPHHRNRSTLIDWIRENLFWWTRAGR